MAKRPKLPVVQLAILSICRFAEPVAYTSVLPYLPEMVESFGVPKDSIGKWVGICGAAFSLSQCSTAILWGRASDRFGRKTTILSGLSLTLLSTLLFGFSQTLTAAILVRAFAGLANGNGGILRTTAAEMVPHKELQPRVFSIMPLMWNVGSFLGPAVGGGLANPAVKYPKLFGSSTLFRKFPYALPNLANSCLFLIGITTAFLFLPETLSSKKHDRDVGLELGKAITAPCAGERSRMSLAVDEEDPLITSGGAEETGTTPVPSRKNASFSWKAVFAKQSRLNLLECLLLGMHSVAFDQMTPVFMHHPRSSENHSELIPIHFLGGFGINSDRIGFLLMLNGLFGMVVQFTIFPPVAKRFGVLKCMKACTMLFSIIYVLFPFTSLIESEETQQAVGLVLIACKCCLTVFAFPCNAILLTNSSASAETLGTLNGVATSVAAIGRTIGPAISGLMFTVGVKGGIIGLPWWTNAAIAVVAAVPVYWMIDMPATGIYEDSGRESEEVRSRTAPNTPQPGR